MIEYYIIETFGSYNPANVGILIGSVISDGATYNLYKQTMVNQPTIFGSTATYNRYYSVRQVKRTGGTITTANHFNGWQAVGLALGSHNLQILAIQSSSSGSVVATVKIISPGGIGS